METNKQNSKKGRSEERSIRTWRSAGELAKTSRFKAHLDNEFPAGDEMTEKEAVLSRRNFSKLMGGAAALAGIGLPSCRRPEAYLVAYKQAPEWMIPGKPVHYATAIPRAGGAIPTVVTTYDGRPTKLEPNKDHKDSSGLDAIAQASIIELYDPSRSKGFLKKGEKAARAEFEAQLKELSANLGKTAFVFGEDDSPTRTRLIKSLKRKAPNAKFYVYEPLVGDAQKAAYGEGVKAIVDFSKAKRILSLDCDFAGLDSQGPVRPFFDLRQGGGHEGGEYKHEIKADKMNRLYMLESAYSLTGGMADHRLPVAPSKLEKLAVAVAANLGVAGLPPVKLEGHEIDWVEECAKDLQEHASEALVLVNSRLGEEMQNLVLAMNQALSKGSADGPITFVKTKRDGYAGIVDLSQDIDNENVENLVWFSPSNPIYDAPKELDFAKKIKKVKISIHWGLHRNATAYACDWHVPAAHYLEAWGDTCSSSGIRTILQPMLVPLYGGVGELELLLAFGEQGDLPKWNEDLPSPALEAVRKTSRLGDKSWKKALREGFIQKSAYKPTGSPSGDASKISQRVIGSGSDEKGLEVVLIPDASVWDGRHIDNPWLQEAPDPISKLTWDNAAYVSPKTAKELGVYERLVALEPENVIFGKKVKNAPRPDIGEGRDAKAPMVLVKAGGQELEIPMLVSFGHADGVISISLGYGQAADDSRSGASDYDSKRPVVSYVGLNRGVDAYRLYTNLGEFTISGASVDNVDKAYPVALTQEHHAMYGRALAREVSTASVPGRGDFDKQLDSVKKQGMDSHAPENISLYKSRGSEKWENDKARQTSLLSDKLHQWGMAIDLNTCMGCNACLVACQSENNIPIVGKEQVARGREMHWIRMDRYFAAPEKEYDSHGHATDKKAPEWISSNPEMIPQPVACVQCESAPCETVCPVNATVHTEDGLNAMAYNRCIGTRYCANNCPYKARRFNFFDYNKRNPVIKHNLYRGPWGEKQEGDLKKLQRNPNVSVRMRGVMEKCTYCVQRLESAKIKQKKVLRSKVDESGKVSYEQELSNQDLRIKVDTVKTACQDACPAGAITFGNLLDGNKSAVNRAKASPRNYDLLNYIGTLPRTSYLARVKNPNPAMPDAKYRGVATIHMH